jgi:hypothetical protein
MVDWTVKVCACVCTHVCLLYDFLIKQGILQNNNNNEDFDENLTNRELLPQTQFCQ